MKPDLPLIDGEGVGRQVNRRGTIEFGDVASGFERADRKYEDLFFFEGNTHLPMEEHSAVAQWEPEPRGRVLSGPLPRCRITSTARWRRC